MQAKKTPQQITLEKMQSIHAFIKKHDGCSVKEMCEHFGVAESTLRHSLALLVDSGHIEKEYGKRCQHGQEPNAYYITGISKPIAAPKRKNHKPYKPRAGSAPDPTIKRKFTEAKQIGIARDWLVAALFGPAAHAMEAS